MTMPTAGSSASSASPLPLTPELRSPRSPGSKARQFDLKSLFWLTITIGVAMAFLRPFGKQVVIEGSICIGIAIAVGNYLTRLVVPFVLLSGRRYPAARLR